MVIYLFSLSGSVDLIGLQLGLIEFRLGSTTFFLHMTFNNAAHSALMFAALMIGHHFSISALWYAPRASAVC